MDVSLLVTTINEKAVPEGRDHLDADDPRSVHQGPADL